MRNPAVIEAKAPLDCCAPLGASALSSEEAAAAAALFSALADPARVRIVNLVATSAEPICACHLIEPLGLSQPTVSHHLKRLVDVGLLEREQRGKWAYFSLSPEASYRLSGLVDLAPTLEED
jgi:ArsR family transcriptional regulator, arsenate/arsenite/antimonite-responsive transcriptional repressor